MRSKSSTPIQRERIKWNERQDEIEIINTNSKGEDRME